MAKKTPSNEREKERLRKQIVVLRDKLSDIEDAENEAEARPFVGRFFKYRNNYSCPSKPEDYWWLYAKVIAIDRGNYLSLVQFQTDKDGHTSVQKQGCYTHLLASWTEIEEREYLFAWNKARVSMDALVWS